MPSSNTPQSADKPDVDKTWDQLLSELKELRVQNATLRESEVKCKGIAELLRVSEARCRASEPGEAERKRLFDVLEYLPAMICLLTPDYHVAFANRAFRERFGESRGRPCYEYRFGRNEPCKFCESYKALETGKPHHWEVKGPDGSVIDVYDVPFTDVDGSPMILEMDIDITERKRAEEALKFTQFALDNFRDSAIWLTKDGRIVYVNQEACRGLGYSREELLSMHLWDVDPDYTMERLGELWPQKVMGDHTKFESRHVARDGRVFPVEVTSSYMKYGDKEYLVTFDRNITDRKRMEREFRLTKFSVEKASDEIFWMESDGRAAYVNDAACRVLGYSREELLSMYVWDWDPGFSPDIWREFFIGLREKGFKNFDTLHRTKDGRVFPVEIAANYIKYGGKEYSFAFVRDITERKKAQDVLAGERQRFYALLDNLPAFVYLQDRDYSVRFANRQFRNMFSEPKNRPCYSIIRGRHTPCPDCPTFRVFDTLQPQQWEWATANGNIYQIYDYPFQDTDGTHLVLEMGIDITERKRAEKELKESKARAELYVDLMGHDINNMNQSAQGFLELALQTLDADGRIGPDGRVLIEKPLQAVQGSSRLISNVRTLQRLSEEGVKTRSVDLRDLFEDIKTQDFNVGDRDAIININEVPHWVVEGSDLLRDVFFNLISNAVKHSRPDMPVTVDVGAERVDRDGRTYYRCTVEDDGPGVADVLKPRLFQRFQRGKTRAHGKGLGLYLVRTLVEGFHGKVWVEDRIKGDHTKGARFVVMLPAVGD